MNINSQSLDPISKDDRVVSITLRIYMTFLRVYAFYYCSPRRVFKLR
jgi:hypothetical protein